MDAAGRIDVGLSLHMDTSVILQTPALDLEVTSSGLDPPVSSLSLSPTRLGASTAETTASLSLPTDPDALSIASSLLAFALMSPSPQTPPPLTARGAGTDSPCLMQAILDASSVILPPLSPGDLGGVVLPFVYNVSDALSPSSPPSSSSSSSSIPPLAPYVSSILVASTSSTSAQIEVVVDPAALLSGASFSLVGNPSMKGRLSLTSSASPLPPSVVAKIPTGLPGPLLELDLFVEPVVSGTGSAEKIQITLHAEFPSELVAQSVILPFVPLWEVDDVPAHLFSNPLFALLEYTSNGGNVFAGSTVSLGPHTDDATPTLWTRLVEDIHVDLLLPSDLAEVWDRAGKSEDGTGFEVALAELDVEVDGPFLSGVAAVTVQLPSGFDGVPVRVVVPVLDGAVVATQDLNKAPTLAPAMTAHSQAVTAEVSLGNLFLEGHVVVASSPMAASAMSLWLSGAILPVYGKLTETPSGKLPSLLHGVAHGVRWRYTLGTQSTLYELRSLDVQPIGPSDAVHAVAQLWLGLEWLHLDASIPMEEDGIPIQVLSSETHVASLSWPEYRILSDAVSSIPVIATVVDTQALGSALGDLDLTFRIWPDPATAQDSFVTALLAGVVVDGGRGLSAPVPEEGDGSSSSSWASLFAPIVVAGKDPESSSPAILIQSALAYANTLITAELPPLAVSVSVPGYAAAGGGEDGSRIVTGVLHGVSLAPGSDSIPLRVSGFLSSNATLLMAVARASAGLSYPGDPAGVVEVTFGADGPFGASSSNLVSRILSALSFTSPPSGSPSGPPSPPSPPWISMGNVTYQVMGSDLDFLDLQAHVPVHLPGGLPDLDLGLPSLTFSYDGSTVGSLTLNTNLIHGGVESTDTTLVFEGVVSAETSRSALESLINVAAAGDEDVPLGTLLRLSPGSNSGPSHADYVADYTFVFPSRSSKGGGPPPPGGDPSPSPPGFNSVVECTELADLDFGYFEILEGKCTFTASINIFVHNPSPLSVGVSSVHFDLYYDNPHGVCELGVCIYHAASNLFLAHVDDPSPTPKPGELPFELLPHSSGKTVMNLTPSSVEMCLRLGAEYEMNDHLFHIHVRNGKAVLHVENMVLNLEFELPDYVVRRDGGQPCLPK